MPETSLKLTPPDLNDGAELKRFPADAELVESEYSGFLFSSLKYSGRPLPGIRFDRCLIEKTVLAKSSLRSAMFEDTRIASCDLSAADWTGTRFSRVEFASCRLTGFVAAEGRLENVAWLNCKADYAVFPLARLTRCRFEKCDLSNATFEGASLTHVTLRDCNLTGARFIRTNLSDVDLRGSCLDGLEIEVESLKGVRIDVLQAPAIAALTGVIIENSAAGDYTVRSRT
ncbi:MAG TPA: pentapeptide repeat-containing protein [Pirellulales bacterium]|nr:pentapeptide repeat-containing protein [Pirellulales bacterium]